MTTRTVGSLCSGYGGLEMGLDLSPVWHAEMAEAPSKVLEKRFPGVPNHGNISAVDWRGIDRPDVIAAGFPCQGSSAAGKRLGRADHRWLWPEVNRAIRYLSPGEIIIENVQNLLRIDGGHAFHDILCDLADAGYAARWTVLGACAEGSWLAHHRHRLFLRALPASGARRPAFRRWPAAGVMHSGQVHPLPTAACGAPCGRPPLLPTPRATDGPNGGPGQRGRRGDLALPSAVQPEHFGKFAPAVIRHVMATGTPPPAPTEPNANGAPRLAAAFAEWLMDIPAGHVTDVLNRNDALTTIGNGVVPRTAAAAYRILSTPL